MIWSRFKEPAGIYGGGGGGGGGAPKRNVFLDSNFANPTIKKSKDFLPNLKYQLKCKYPQLSHITHVLYHFCDMNLITACAIFCRAKKKYVGFRFLLIKT